MRRFKPGSSVRLTEPVRRGRRHKHGPARLKRGVRGRVKGSHRHWRKGVLYDLQVQKGRGPEQIVRSVPANKLKGPSRAQYIAVVALILILLLYVLLWFERS